MTPSRPQARRSRARSEAEPSEAGARKPQARRSRARSEAEPSEAGARKDDPAAPRPLRVVTWNVNGLRACARKGFRRWLGRCGADLVAVQEVRAFPEQLPEAVRSPLGWHTAFAWAERPGYSGVGLFARLPPDRVESRLGRRRFDAEGRLQIARFGRLAVVNAYFPKGSGSARDNSRVPYKLAFYRAVLERAQRLRRAGLRVLVLGDFNTAHREIDLARPRDNRRNSGFLPEERAEVDRWLAAGWVDAFRALHPGEPGHYTWWRQWGGARERNVGWRIDYVLASPAAMRYVRGAFLWPRVRGSDHCPAGVDLDPAILGRRGPGHPGPTGHAPGVKRHSPRTAPGGGDRA